MKVPPGLRPAICGRLLRHRITVMIQAGNLVTQDCSIILKMLQKTAIFHDRFRLAKCGFRVL
jgi:hypothetical protein